MKTNFREKTFRILSSRIDFLNSKRVHGDFGNNQSSGKCGKRSIIITKVLQYLNKSVEMYLQQC